jgi:hypothetical protein
VTEHTIPDDVRKLLDEGKLNSVDVHYYDEAGNITQTATIQRLIFEQEVEACVRVAEGRAVYGKHRRNMKTGEIEEIPPQPEPEPTYVEKRLMAYPPVNEFLDAFSEAYLADPTSLPPPLRDYIGKVAAVKNKFKKEG